MKKSVLLPYERYQQLLQNSGISQNVAATISPDVTENATPTLPPQASAEPIVHNSLETVATKLNADVIVACLPKRNRFKAKRLLDYIEKHSNLDWNKQGNLTVENQPIEYSHIVDLLHDALTATRHDPTGHVSFYNNLSGIPQSLINNPRRKSLIGGRLPPPGLPPSEPKALNVWKTNWKAL